MTTPLVDLARVEGALDRLALAGEGAATAYERGDKGTQAMHEREVRDLKADLLATVTRLAEAVRVLEGERTSWLKATDAATGRADKMEQDNARLVALLGSQVARAEAAEAEAKRLRAAVEDAHGADCEIVTGRKDGARVRPECSCGYFDRRRAALAPRPTPPGEER